MREVITLVISVAKGLKLKVRKSWGLISMFLEITEEKLVRAFLPPILNRVKGPFRDFAFNIKRIKAK